MTHQPQLDAKGPRFLIWSAAGSGTQDQHGVAVVRTGSGHTPPNFASGRTETTTQPLKGEQAMLSPPASRGEPVRVSYGTLTRQPEPLSPTFTSTGPTPFAQRYPGLRHPWDRAGSPGAIARSRTDRAGCSAADASLANPRRLSEH